MQPQTVGKPDLTDDGAAATAAAARVLIVAGKGHDAGESAGREASRLQRLGHEPCIARDVDEALALAALQPFDAVILADANDAFLSSRAGLPDLLIASILAIDDGAGAARALLEAGADDLLPLPGDNDDDTLLRARLRAAAERTRLRRREPLYRAQIAHARTQAERERARADALLNAVIPIGAALTVEKNLGRLLERILIEAQKFCNADSGSLYLLTGDALEFAIVRNDSLGLAMGGTTGIPITFPPVPLADTMTGTENRHYIVVHAALTGGSVNIADAYEAATGKDGFDFSGTRAFDARTGYRSTSLLAVPLRNGEGAVIGVLQLINALDWQTKEIVPFDANMQQIIEALGRLAAIALQGYIREQNLTDQLRQLRIEIDEAKKAKHVAEITDTDYFRHLQQRSKHLRERHQANIADENRERNEESRG